MCDSHQPLNGADSEPIQTPVSEALNRVRDRLLNAIEKPGAFPKRELIRAVYRIFDEEVQ